MNIRQKRAVVPFACLLLAVFCPTAMAEGWNKSYPDLGPVPKEYQAHVVNLGVIQFTSQYKGPEGMESITYITDNNGFQGMTLDGPKVVPGNYCNLVVTVMKCPDEKTASDIYLQSKNHLPQRYPGGTIMSFAGGDEGVKGFKITGEHHDFAFHARKGNRVFSFFGGGGTIASDERIARAVNGDGDTGKTGPHAVLISILRMYKTGLFDTVTDADLEAALANGENALPGTKRAPTSELMELLPKIQAIQALMKLPEPPDGASLLNLPEVQSQAEETLWNFSEAVEDLLPPPLGPACKALRWIRKADVQTRKTRQWTDLHFAEKIYQSYHADLRQNPTTDTLGTFDRVWATGKGNALVRDCAELRSFPLPKAVTLARLRFEERHALDTLREAILEARQNGAKTIEGLLDSKKDALRSICAEAEQIRYQREKRSGSGN